MKHGLDQATALFCRFWKFLSGSLDQFGEINLKGFGHAQYSFQGRIPLSVLNVCDHLGGKAGFLGDKVFGPLAAFAFFLKEGNNFDTKKLGVSFHFPVLQKKSVDCVFHYGGILHVDYKTRRKAVLIGRL